MRGVLSYMAATAKRDAGSVEGTTIDKLVQVMSLNGALVADHAGGTVLP